MITIGEYGKNKVHVKYDKNLWNINNINISQETNVIDVIRYEQKAGEDPLTSE